MNRTIKVALFIFILFTAALIGVYFLCTDMTLKEMRQSFLINSFSGIFVSFIFILLLLRFFRPKFEISPYICHRDGKYYFKVVNKSIYHAFDVTIELFAMTPYLQTESFPSVTMGSVPLQYGNVSTINRFRRNNHTKDPYSLFAINIATEFDVESKISEEKVFFEIRLTARHGLTGLADRFIQRFPNEEVIKENHKFCYGDDLGTMPKNRS